MNINISNNNYTNQLVQPILSYSTVRTASNYALLILIETTANVAIFTFFIIKTTALLPLTAIAIPDLIGNRYFEANSYLLGLTVTPFTISRIGFDYIEDVVIRTNQKVLDILHIPIALPVSYLTLKDTLKKWENENPLQLVNHREASQRILSFSNTLCWEPIQELHSILKNYIAQSPRNFRLLFDIGMCFLFQHYTHLGDIEAHIDLSNLQLQSLPPIFHYKNYRDFSLDLDNNQLTTLPESIFSLPSRCAISVRNNNFSEEYLVALRRRVSSNDYNGPHIVWETYRSVSEALDITDVTRVSTTATINNRIPYEIVSNIGNLPRSESLITWLNKLTEVKEYHNVHTRANLIAMVIDYLQEANRNEEFRETFLYNVNEGYNTCGDRTALSILRIDIAHQLATASLSDMSKLSKIYLKGALTIDLLEECAREKVNRENIKEAIETYLIYPIKLRKDLEIPIKLNNMLFPPLSRVTRSDLTVAKNYVLEYLQVEENCLNFLIEQKKWIESLEENYKDKMEEAKRTRDNAVEELEGANSAYATSAAYAEINDAYKKTLKDLSKKGIQSSGRFWN